MTKISSELSDKIRSLWKAGHCLSDIRDFLGQSGVQVSNFTIRRHCYFNRKKTGIKKPTVLKMNSAALKVVDQILQEDNERSAKKIQSELHSRLHLRVSINTIRRSIKKLGWTYGKVRTDPAIRDNNKSIRFNQRSEIEALKKQLHLCKAAHASETEALRKELQDCKEACAYAKTALADLDSTHKQLMQSHTILVTQLRELQRHNNSLLNHHTTTQR